MEIRKYRKIIGINIAFLFFVALGFGASQYFSYQKASVFSEFVAGLYSKTTLHDSTILINKTEDWVSCRYSDPRQIINDAHKIVWDVKKSVTPFVMNAPTPGGGPGVYINKYQMRTTIEDLDVKRNNTYRIFITGGSTAFGSGVPQDYTIGEFLLQLLTKACENNDFKVNFEVITAACPAWSSTHELIFISNRISKLHPDLVIQFSGNNDVHWGFNKTNPLWMYSYNDLNILKILEYVGDYLGVPRVEIYNEKHAFPIPPSEVARGLSDNIVLSNMAVGVAKADHVFVLQPTLPALYGDDDRSRYFRECYQSLENTSVQLSTSGIYFFNLNHVFAQHPQWEALFLDAYHFGDKGNLIIAQEILNYLRAEQILPHLLHCKSPNFPLKNSQD